MITNVMNVVPKCQKCGFEFTLSDIGYKKNDKIVCQKCRDMQPIKKIIEKKPIEVIKEKPKKKVFKRKK
jgi:hypothetical protein